MATRIEWANETWNPLVGCKAVSPGCENCYAAREASGRLSAHPIYQGLAVNGVFTGEIRLVPERLDQPARWKRPRRIFVNSMSDLFHPDVPDEFRRSVFDVMANAPQHTFQILTKRPQIMAKWVQGYYDCDHGGSPVSTCQYCLPLPNVWLGVSIESDRYTFRADHLRDTPAAVRFLSLEPLLGPLPSLDLTGIDWVIVGGESGPGARPMHPDWVRDIRDRCSTNPCERCQGGKLLGEMRGGCGCARQPLGDTRYRSGRRPVPFLFKQWGEWQPTPIFDAPDTLTGRAFKDGAHGGTLKATPGNYGKYHWLDDNTMAVRVGKKAAGRELDGELWDQYPGRVIPLDGQGVEVGK